MLKFIDIRDLDTERNVSLCIEKDGSFTLLGGIPHATKLRLSKDNIEKMKAWCDDRLKEYT